MFIAYCLLAILVNAVIGAGVWAAIDHPDQRLYRWYHDCPKRIAWFAQPIVLSAWPVGLWLWFRERDVG